MPKITLDGYVIVTEAVQRDGSWMPAATIHDDRPDVDLDDVTDDYRVIAPDDAAYGSRQEALDQAEVLGRTWVAQRG